MSSTATFSIDALRLQARQALSQTNTDQAESIVQFAICSLLETSPGQLRLLRDVHLTTDQQNQWDEWLVRMANGEPIQYITAEAPFMNLTLTCDRRALIPRPETEQLVEWILSDPAVLQKPSPDVVDVGTGSGCILLALAQAMPHGHFYGLDLHPEALELAALNRRQVAPEIDIRFIQSHLLEQMPRAGADLIVANLPYISIEDWQDLPKPVRNYEPASALTDQKDGLHFVSELVASAVKVLKTEGLLYLEIGEKQGDAVCTMLRHHDYTNLELKADYAGKPRMIRASAPQ